MKLDEHKEKQKWLLSHSERQYLNGNDVKYPQKRRRNIEKERVPNLGNRIQYLIDDIALLEKGGYLDRNQDYFQQEDVVVQARLDERERYTSYPFSDLINRKGDPLGLAIGQLTRSLLSATNWRWTVYEVIWQFILGMIGREESLEPEFQVDLYHLTEFINERREQRREFREAYQETSIVSPKRIEKAIAEPTKIVAKKDHPIGLELFKIRSDELEYDLDSLSLNVMETIKFPVEETKQYLQFKEHLKMYSNSLTDSQWKGIPGEGVFRELWMATKKLSSKDIKDNYNESHKSKISDKGNVSKLMADFAGQDRGQRHLAESIKWADNPIVREIELNNNPGRQWDTTPYGDVVGNCVFEEDGISRVWKNIARLLVQGEPRTKLQTKILNSVDQIDEI